jgi:hypothetical protein
VKKPGKKKKKKRIPKLPEPYRTILRFWKEQSIGLLITGVTGTGGDARLRRLYVDNPAYCSYDYIRYEDFPVHLTKSCFITTAVTNREEVLRAMAHFDRTASLHVNAITNLDGATLKQFPAPKRKRRSSL